MIPASPPTWTALLPCLALPERLLVHAEASVTPGPRQKGAAAGRLLNSTARALQVKTKASNARGPMNLFSDTFVEKRYYKWGWEADSGYRAWGWTQARLDQLGWVGPWSLYSLPSRVWLALGSHQDHSAGSGTASGGGVRGRPNGRRRRKEGRMGSKRVRPTKLGLLEWTDRQPCV